MHTRFGALDAMRGLAALAVVVFHLGQLKLTVGLLPHAYLAVDFFFILSGFVIAYTYEPKLGAGMPVRDFLVRRLVRLYPMVLLAVCLGGAVLLLKAHVDPGRADSTGRIDAGLAMNLAMLPNLVSGTASRGLLFPGNGPLWSVSFEILANLVWCLALARARTRTVAALVAFCFAGLVACVSRDGSANLGFDWYTVPGGLARIGYGFGLGILLHRGKDLLILGRDVAPKILGALGLAIAFAAPHKDGFDVAWDLVCTGLVIPLVVILGLNSSDHPRLDKALGDASYPLYAIHFPILLLASGLHQTRPQLGSTFILAATAMAIAMATYAATRFYDEPLRGALTAWWRRAGKARNARRQIAARGIV